jgi:hypothetical protein
MMRIDYREETRKTMIAASTTICRVLHRRGMLKLVAGAPLGPADARGLRADGDTAQATQTSDTADGEMPEETSGPYPGDGSNGANVLTQSGIVRSDITSSFGSSTTKAEGVPLSITMTINDFANNKSPLAGGAVYVWHCDREGRYSLYSQGVTNENYLRGVQEADDGGQRCHKIGPANPADGRIFTSRCTKSGQATSSANKIERRVALRRPRRPFTQRMDMSRA